MRRRLPDAGPGPGGWWEVEIERSVEVEVRREEMAVEARGEAMVDMLFGLDCHAVRYPGIDVLGSCPVAHSTKASDVHTRVRVGVR